MSAMGGKRTLRWLPSGMMFKPRIILHAPVIEQAKLEPFVDQCLQAGVRLIAIVGSGCEALEEEIDWMIIGDGFDPSRLICTTSHPDETLEEVREFASIWICDGDDGYQELRL